MLSGMADSEILDIARDVRNRKPSKVESRWLDFHCRQWVRGWLEKYVPERLLLHPPVRHTAPPARL